MANTFEEYVDEWDVLVGKIKKAEAELKPLKDLEKQMRLAIVEAAKKAAGSTWKEGTNTLVLADERKLKINYKLDRKIDEGSMQDARDEFAKLNDTPCTFDEIFRVKHELDKKNYSKLGSGALTAVSRCLVTKEATPEVKFG